MKKKRGMKKKVHSSNRIIYFFVTLGILIAVAVGVYAYGTSNPAAFGHSGSEIAVDNAFCTRITGHNCGEADYCAGGNCRGAITVNGPITVTNINTFAGSKSGLTWHGTPNSNWCKWSNEVSADDWRNWISGTNYMCCRYIGSNMHTCNFYVMGHSQVFGGSDTPTYP
jgi:hypothetical protein